jgi:hypothetical protein
MKADAGPPLPQALVARSETLLPPHYSGSVCGRGLSANPASTLGFADAINYSGAIAVWPP